MRKEEVLQRGMKRTRVKKQNFKYLGNYKQSKLGKGSFCKC